MVPFLIADPCNLDNAYPAESYIESQETTTKAGGFP